MKRTFLVSVILLLHFFSGAQTAFQTTVNGARYAAGNAITETSDGGFAVAGTTTLVQFAWQAYDMYVARFSANGSLQWRRYFDAFSFDFDAGYSIIQTNDGGFAVTGRTGYMFFKVFVVKMDSLGITQWAYTISTDPQQFEEGFSIVQTNDHGYVVSAKTYNTFNSNYDAYVIKLDSLGTLQWSKTVVSGSMALGGTLGYSLVQTADHGYALDGTIDNGIMIVKLDSAGNTQWSKLYRGAGIDMVYPFSKSLIQTSDSGFAIAGMTGSLITNIFDMYVLKLNSAGNEQWTRTIGGPGDDQGYSIAETTDHGFIVSGITNSFGGGGYDMYAVKLDGSGSLIWQNTIGGADDDYGYGVVSSANGSSTIAGKTNSLGPGDEIMYVVQIDSNGYSCENLHTASGIVSNGDSGIAASAYTIITTSVSVGGSVSDYVGSATTYCSTRCPVIPLIHATGPTALCPGHFVMLNADTAPGRSYQWKFNDSDIPGAFTSSYHAVYIGEYSCTVSDSCGFATSNIITVTHVNNPFGVYIAAGGPTTFCSDTSVQLYVSNITGVPPYSYFWVRNGVGIQGANSSSYSVSQSGHYRCDAYDSCGFGSSSSILVTVWSPNDSVSVTGLVNLCAGDSITITAAPGLSYNWSTNDTTQLITTGTAGNYFVTVTDSHGCSSTSDTVNISVVPMPVVSFTGLPDTVCLTSATNILAGTPVGGIFSGDGISGNIFSSSIAGSGNHVIIYNYMDVFGCSGSDTQDVYVDICSQVEVISPDLYSVKVFPNPVSDQFTLRVESVLNSKYIFKLNDISGRELENHNNIPVNENFTFGKNLTPGFYFAEIIFGNIRKIVPLVKN